MTMSQIEPRLFTTESPDQPTHPMSVGSTMAITFSREPKQEANVTTTSSAKSVTKARQDALERAAGPYLVRPEHVGIEWFAQAHPAPWMRWVYMNAEIAGYLLREHNLSNRPLRPGRVDYYKKIIVKNVGRDGEFRSAWRLTHQGIAMDTEGALQDGQHRLAAIVDAANELDIDLEVGMAFFVGMAPENFAAIDENLNRSPMDLFAKGGVKYGPAITTAIRLSLAFDQQTPRRLLREKQSNEAILSYFAEHDSDLLQEAAKFASTFYKRTKSSPGPLAAAFYLLHDANGKDNRYVHAFMDGLVTGLKSGTRITLDDDDPRKVVRNYFENVKDGKRRLPGIDALSIVVIAWNNVVQGLRPRNVRYTDDTPVPRIMICEDTGPNRSAVPSALVGEIDE